MKIKCSPLELDRSPCAHVCSPAKPSGVSGSHHCLESVTRSISQENLNAAWQLFIYILSNNSGNDQVYLSENAVDGFLVHVAIDGIFAQARSDSAEVVQRCHPECHFGVLVTELVHLEYEMWGGGGGRHQHQLNSPLDWCLTITRLKWATLLTSSRPSKLSSSSAAGHSGRLTADSRSWTKFSNRGL